VEKYGEGFESPLKSSFIFVSEKIGHLVSKRIKFEIK